MYDSAICTSLKVLNEVWISHIVLDNRRKNEMLVPLMCSKCGSLMGPTYLQKRKSSGDMVAWAKQTMSECRNMCPRSDKPELVYERPCIDAYTPINYILIQNKRLLGCSSWDTRLNSRNSCKLLDFVFVMYCVVYFS